jgi:type II secretory pathway component GspD/PulD (secretin)
MRIPVLAVAMVLTLAIAAHSQPPRSAARVVFSDPADTETQIACEVRILSVPEDFFERLGIDLDVNAKGTLLTDRQMTALMEAVQADPRANVLQAPKVTLADGQAAMVQATERRRFVSGLDAVTVDGQSVFVPKHQDVELGWTLSLKGHVSPDGKSVATAVEYRSREIGGQVPLVPVISYIEPVADGKKGQSIPFTQYVEAPKIDTTAMWADCTIPAGQHALVLGPVTTREARNEFGPPYLTKIPYVNRMFKNVGIGRETVRTLLVVTPRVLSEPVVVPRPVPEAVVRASQAENDTMVRRAAFAEAQQPQVLVNAIFVKVPSGFAESAGISASAEEGKWVLNEREARMLTAALRREKDSCEVLSRPQILVPDRRAGFMQVGQNGPLARNLSLRLTPAISRDGTIRLEIQNRQVEHVAGTVARTNTAVIETSESVPTGGTLVIRGTNPGDAESELLIVLTPQIK